MAVFRIEKNKNYTVISNHHLRNKELSLRSKGLLSLMLSLPEEWDYTLKGLSIICIFFLSSFCSLEVFDLLNPISTILRDTRSINIYPTQTRKMLLILKNILNADQKSKRMMSMRFLRSMSDNRMVFMLLDKIQLYILAKIIDKSAKTEYNKYS